MSHVVFSSISLKMFSLNVCSMTLPYLKVNGYFGIYIHFLKAKIPLFSSPQGSPKNALIYERTLKPANLNASSFNFL